MRVGCPVTGWRKRADLPEDWHFTAPALTALMYSHPLGLLMALALGLASLIVRRELGLSWKRWLTPYLAAALGIAPWIGRYFNEPLERMVGRKSITTVIDIPLGFLGGNHATLFGFLALMAIGLLAIHRDGSKRRRNKIDTTPAAALLPLLAARADTPAHVRIKARRSDQRRPLRGAGLHPPGGVWTGKAAEAPRSLRRAGDHRSLGRRVARHDLRARPEPFDRRAAGRGPRPSRSLARGAGHLRCVVQLARRRDRNRELLPFSAPQKLPGAASAGSIAPQPTNQAWLAFGVRDGKQTTKIPGSVPPDSRRGADSRPPLCLIAVEPDLRAPPPKDAASP